MPASSARTAVCVKSVPLCHERKATKKNAPSPPQPLAARIDRRAFGCADTFTSFDVGRAIVVGCSALCLLFFAMSSDLPGLPHQPLALEQEAHEAVAVVLGDVVEMHAPGSVFQLSEHCAPGLYRLVFVGKKDLDPHHAAHPEVGAVPQGLEPGAATPPGEALHP